MLCGGIKMSKELNALNKIAGITNYDGGKNLKALGNSHKKEFSLLETALKDYEMEHTLRIRLENINYELVREKQKNEKELKALEIIKEKEVNVKCIMSGWSLGKYNSYQAHISLTQEEFDLLKEALKNE